MLGFGEVRHSTSRMVKKGEPRLESTLRVRANDLHGEIGSRRMSMVYVLSCRGRRHHYCGKCKELS